MKDDPHDKVYIESRGPLGRNSWVVFHKSYVLGKDGEWHYEPLPSSRTDEFIELTRFPSAQDAYQAWIEFSNAEQKGGNLYGET